MMLSPLSTRRLVLRPPRADDAGAIFERYASDPRVTRYLSWPTARSVADVEPFVAACTEAWQGQSRRPWVIALPTDDAPLGMIEARLEDNGFSASVGYVLARRAWGRGYATEAAQAVVAALMALPAIYRVWAFCDVENQASARVLEKANLIFEGTLRRYVVHPNVSAEPRDARMYARTR